MENPDIRTSEETMEDNKIEEIEKLINELVTELVDTIEPYVVEYEDSSSGRMNEEIEMVKKEYVEKIKTIYKARG